MRRIVVLATAAALVVGASVSAGVAMATSSWTTATVATPKGYFEFCADKQQDIAGITAADLAGDNNGGHPFAITTTLYPNLQPGGTIQQQTNGDEAGYFQVVRSKSGITTTATTGLARQIQVAQYVEYRDTAAKHPTQIRCKMRTAESLNKSGFQKDLDTDASPTTIPWGFGAGTASGPEGTCAAINQESIANAWNQLDDQEKDDAPFRPEVRDGDPANITVAPDKVTANGPDWTLAWNSLYADAGQLTVRSKSVIASSTYPGLGGDKLRGAHYCTLVAPEYLVDVFKGDVTPPATPAPPAVPTAQDEWTP